MTRPPLPLFTEDTACMKVRLPELSTVGVTEEEAMDKGLEVNVTTSGMSNWISTKTYAEIVAWSKVLVDEKEDRIIRAQTVGHHSQELIHLFSMAIRHGIPASSLKNDLFAFPTFSSDLKCMF